FFGYVQTVMFVLSLYFSFSLNRAITNNDYENENENDQDRTHSIGCGLEPRRDVSRLPWSLGARGAARFA
ncbi:MAG: hypothetical protein ACREH8_02625, partial [Opitutaceae bacterium]